MHSYKNKKKKTNKASVKTPHLTIRIPHICPSRLVVKHREIAQYHLSFNAMNMLVVGF